jgi:hypothetical protein
MQHIPPRGGDETTQLTKKPDRQGEGAMSIFKWVLFGLISNATTKLKKKKSNRQIFWQFFI